MPRKGQVAQATDQGEVAFQDKLARLARGEVVKDKSVGSMIFIDTDKLTGGQQKCGEVLLWLCQKVPFGDASATMPPSALPLLP